MNNPSNGFGVALTARAGAGKAKPAGQVALRRFSRWHIVMRRRCRTNKIRPCRQMVRLSAQSHQSGAAALVPLSVDMIAAHRWWEAFAIFVVAGASDALDGWSPAAST